MNKTLRLSFSLKNTYRVNSILYSLKQIPFIKKLLPETLYKVKGLKIFANILSIIWEIISVFLGKLIYFLTMIIGVSMLYETTANDQLFLHILLFLTIIGAFMNTYMFNPTRDKYYAMILMKMNAREYTLVNYGFSIIKVIIGFFPIAIYFGLQNNIPIWICILIPFFIAGLKLTSAAFSLINYEKTGRTTNENGLGKFMWLFAGLLLASAYGLPAIGFIIPSIIIICIMCISIILGIISLRKILCFRYYREMYQQILVKSINQMDNTKQVSQQMSQKVISADTNITSHKKGFEYLNEIFIKRHQKILWKSSIRIATVCLFLILGVLLAFYLAPETKDKINELF